MSPPEMDVVDRLIDRGLVFETDCEADDSASHYDVSPLGRTALLADAAARGLVTT